MNVLEERSGVLREYLIDNGPTPKVVVATDLGWNDNEIKGAIQWTREAWRLGIIKYTIPPLRANGLMCVCDTDVPQQIGHVQSSLAFGRNRQRAHMATMASQDDLFVDCGKVLHLPEVNRWISVNHLVHAAHVAIADAASL